MKLIVGLGNPGKEYENTRHNVGFMCVDMLQQKFGFPDFTLQKKFSAEITNGNLNNQKIILAKPQTYMNVSGKSVAGLFNFYHLGPNDLWLIYDDIDLPLGKIRVREKGSAGTHNGMKSVIAELGFSNFQRVRIGIESRGESAPQKQDISSFVLHPFLKKEAPVVEKALEDGTAAILEKI